MSDSFDVIVVGLGAMGSVTTYRTAGATSHEIDFLAAGRFSRETAAD